MQEFCECAAVDGLTPGGDGSGASKNRIANLGALKNDKKALHGLWRTIVEDYNLLDLTVENDRLPALSGLASRFEKHLPWDDRYLAGLWKSDRGRDLLWESGGRLQRDAPNRRRSSDAPSWSWASLVWGGANGGSTMRWERESKPKLASFAETVTYKQDPRFRVLDASIQVDGVNPYGRVTSGCLVLQGAVVAVVISHSSNKQTARRNSSFLTVPENSLNSLELWYDTAEVQRSIEGAWDVDGRTVSCLYIGTFTEVFDESYDPNVNLMGLMLRPSTKARGKWERVGRWQQTISEHWVWNKDIWTNRARLERVEII
jgi:hypothetical protein